MNEGERAPVIQSAALSCCHIEERAPCGGRRGLQSEL